MIKYLKSTSGSAAINLGSVAALLTNASLFNNVITIANLAVSTSSTTGALIVRGGVGIGGALNVAGNSELASLKATSGDFATNVLISGTLTSSTINNIGSITATSAQLGILGATTVTATGLGTFNSLQVNNLANIGQLNALSGQINSLTATSIGAGSLTTASFSTTNLNVDNIVPRSGLQVNFGSADKIRITGGTNGQVLGTDGSGNLAWFDGPGSLVVGSGLTRVGNTISLAQTGFEPGVYDRVTVDVHGRVVSGTSTVDTLDLVVSRGATTGRVINLTNATDSTDPTEGALIVAGGVGVGGTLVSNQIVAKDTLTVEQTLYAQDLIQASKTVFLNGVDSGIVPLNIKAGGLIAGAAQGSIEFDGDYLYITTTSGRQILAARDLSAPASPVMLVRAVATTNINVGSATQVIDEADAWDDVNLVAFDRVLLTTQSNSVENGVWIFQGEGAPLVRATDANALTGLFNGTTIFVSQGTAYGGSFYQVETPNPVAVGVSNISIVQHFNKDNIAVAGLPKDSTSGLMARTTYGTVELRRVVSNSSWITVANADAKSGNITLSTGIVPVASGGTGRTNIIGYMRGTGTSIVSSNTIPLANIAGAGTMASQNSNNVSITGGTVSVASVTATAATIGNLQVQNTTTTNQLSANTATVGNLTVTGTITAASGLTGNTIQLGTNTSGSLATAAVTVNTTQTVTDTIALMNVVLGKLVPPPPPTFPNSQTIGISSLVTARMADFAQTDNTSSSRTVPAGTTIAAIRRSNSYQTTTVTGSGPGDTGTLAVIKNGSIAGSKVMTANGNGTFNDLVIVNNQDYSLVNPAVTANFWYSFDARATGTVSPGWNEVYINHSATQATNTTAWYYDASAPGTPDLTNTMITEDVAVVSYSSTVPHYTSASRFDVTFDVNRLSGDTYPTSNTFAVGAAGGAFVAPVSLTYAAAGIATPLLKNLYVTAGNINCTTTANIVSGFGSSSIGPTVSVANGYAAGSHTFVPGATVLYKTGTAIQIEETSIPVNSVGSGSGNGQRIISPGTTDTPAYAANATIFNSETAVLGTTDATVVAAVLRHDQTNYSSGHLPIGPNLSVGRSGSQYFTFKFVRSVVSKFNFKYTGSLAGIWIALPGSVIDSTSTLNGWLSLSAAYNGAGVPGAGAGGNGSNGCAVGGTAVLNSVQTNKQVTATFGTASSSATATNEIYVRIKLTSGQSLTAISIEAATN